MDIKELRVGNLIWHPAKKEPWKVTKTGISYPAIKYCHGIELTEQWLLDFGFEKIQIDQKGRGGYEFYIHKMQVVLSDTGDYAFFDSNHTTTTINNVHQLQNLYFALTGKELTKKE